MILKRIYEELKAIREAYCTVNAEKLAYHKQLETPIAKAGRIDYSKVADDEVIFDVDYAKEIADDLEAKEKELWQGK